MCLIRTLANGDLTEEWMTPFWAVDEALFSVLNGKEVTSSHILWGEVSSGTSGISGSGLAAEYSMIIPSWGNLG